MYTSCFFRFVVSIRFICHNFFWSKETENDTRARIDMEFLFSYLTRYLTVSTANEYRVEHEERNFITTCNQGLFCLLWTQQTFAEKKSQIYSDMKRIRFHNPPKKVVKCEGNKVQDEKMHWIITKTKNGRNL